MYIIIYEIVGGEELRLLKTNKKRLKNIFLETKIYFNDQESQ